MQLMLSIAQRMSQLVINTVRNCRQNKKVDVDNSEQRKAAFNINYYKTVSIIDKILSETTVWALGRYNE